MSWSDGEHRTEGVIMVKMGKNITTWYKLQAKEMHDNGFTNEEICESLHISRVGVKKILELELPTFQKNKYLQARLRLKRIC